MSLIDLRECELNEQDIQNNSNIKTTNHNMKREIVMFSVDVVQSNAAK